MEAAGLEPQKLDMSSSLPYVYVPLRALTAVSAIALKDVTLNMLICLLLKHL